MKKTQKRKQRGGDWLPNWLTGKSSEPVVGSTPAPGSLSDSLPTTLVKQPVAEVTTMAKTAGKRMKPMLGGDPTSPKDAEKVLGTAPEGAAPLLGGRRRRVKATRRRRKY